MKKIGAARHCQIKTLESYANKPPNNARAGCRTCNTFCANELKQAMGSEVPRKSKKKCAKSGAQIKALGANLLQEKMLARIQLLVETTELARISMLLV